MPDGFQIVAGERRWRAAQIARLHEVPAILREFDDLEVLEIAIIENIQRADLNAIEEAAGYQQLMDRFGHTQEKLGEALGKSRSHIANTLRLLTLPDTVQTMVSEGKLSAGHARALVTAEDPAALAREIAARGLSVREAEKLAKKAAAPKSADAKSPPRTPTPALLRTTSKRRSACGFRSTTDRRGRVGPSRYGTGASTSLMRSAGA